MKKNSLTENNGLSLSQAQSISNLCNQRARSINTYLLGINNFSKSIIIDGITHTLSSGIPIPDNLVEMLEEKAKLHACQAFLMENIKAKDSLLNEIKRSSVKMSSIKTPVREEFVVYNEIPMVGDDWGMEQLTIGEVNEFIESEAYAAHIGQFIHQGGVLDELRTELPNLAPMEWMTIKDGEKTPVKIEKHHTSEELLKTHEKLAAIHRKHEQRVNYFKAKIKNLVTEENARIAKINADEQAKAEVENNKIANDYNRDWSIYNEKIKTMKNDFEIERQSKIKEVASMRINIDARFQETINDFLNQLEK